MAGRRCSNETRRTNYIVDDLRLLVNAEATTDGADNKTTPA